MTEPSMSCQCSVCGPWQKRVRQLEAELAVAVRTIEVQARGQMVYRDAMRAKLDAIAEGRA